MWVCRRGNSASFPSSPDLTSLLTGGRPAGMHLPALQPSTGQFFASLDPINEASAILSPLSSNPRNSVQHQFQDTFPGTETLLSDGLTGRSTAKTLRTSITWPPRCSNPGVDAGGYHVRRETERFLSELAHSLVGSRG